MAETSAILQGVLATLNATTVAQGTGQVVAASVGPKPGNVDIAEILTGTLDFTWLTKNVSFKNANLEPSLVAADLQSKITQIASPVTVAGLLGQLKGTVPLLNQVSVPVALKVEWSVLDENKKPLATSEFAVLSGQSAADSKVNGVDVVLAFRPAIVEMTKEAPVPAPKQRFLKPKVTLSALDTTVTAPDDRFPEIPVLVPAIGVPRLLAAFRHVDFQPTSGGEDGFVLLFAPANSPLQSLDHLKTTLATVQEAVTAVKAFGDIAGILPGISSLTSGVTASPYFVFVVADEIQNLNDITVIQRSWYENDTELEDEISSMILIGAAGKQLDVYCETELDDENGHCKLTVGPNNFAVVSNLHSKHPDSHPAGSLEVVKEPTHATEDPTFGDWISSMKWL
ncbi:MAG TPA: hypothetical protein VGX28_01920 [Frankiaceae bacterium]|jgi:hypothetical protein|nr:hypothetical protein [Frankiaceae bacterium]